MPASSVRVQQGNLLRKNLPLYFLPFTRKPMMIFPFSIQYSKRIKVKISEENQQIILTYISTFIDQYQGGNISQRGNQILFERGYGVSRSHIFATIDEGVFSLFVKDGTYFLAYEFSMYNLFAIATVITIVASFFSIEAGLIGFLAIGILNWVITIIRHKIMFLKISKNLAQLIQG